MDVLSLIKKDHDQVSCLLAGFRTSSTADDFRSLLAPLRAAMTDLMKIESDYLFPEVDDLFVGADEIVERAIARQGSIKSYLDSLKSTLANSNAVAEDYAPAAHALIGAIDVHIKDQQDLLIPRIRKLIPTQDREDLAEVFIEAKRDLGIAVPEL